jgi:hypothetical protein
VSSSNSLESCFSHNEKPGFLTPRPIAAVAGIAAGGIAVLIAQALRRVRVLAVADAEARKLRHDPWELVSRAIQPVLWLVLFGEIMAQVRGLSSGTTPYPDFLAAGILAQSVLFVAIYYGISAIWERDHRGFGVRDDCDADLSSDDGVRLKMAVSA